MSGRIRARTAIFAVAILAITAAVAIIAGTASSAVTYTPIYNDIPKPLPPNTPSIGFEANSASEFGGMVKFAGGGADNTKVTVGMSSWACQSGGWSTHDCETTAGAKFSWPITLKIYLPTEDGSVGPQIAQLTKTFNMPYRPSANSVKCTGANEGKWYSRGNCYNGKMFKITFPLKGVYLPESAIISVAYNTSHYGADPQAPQPCNSEPQGCFYDSLNVGVEEGFEPPIPDTTLTGEQPRPNDAYMNATSAEAYCDAGEGLGSFRLDPGCWEGFQPEFEVTTG